jgi:hypothetical protein
VSAPLSAAQRLALSRERLRNSLQRPAAPEGGNVVMDALRAWWAQHPLRLAATVATDAAKAAVRPIAERHPFALVLGALLIGGLVVGARPWRGILKPALLAGLLPQLVAKLMAQLPLDSWLAMLASLAEQREPQEAPPPPDPMSRH